MTSKAVHYATAQSTALVADYPVTVTAISSFGGDVTIYDEGTAIVWRQPNGQTISELDIAVNKLYITSVGAASVAYF